MNMAKLRAALTTGMNDAKRTRWAYVVRPDQHDCRWRAAVGGKGQGGIGDCKDRVVCRRSLRLQLHMEGVIVAVGLAS